MNPTCKGLVSQLANALVKWMEENNIYEGESEQQPSMNQMRSMLITWMVDTDSELVSTKPQHPAKSSNSSVNTDTRIQLEKRNDY